MGGAKQVRESSCCHHTIEPAGEESYAQKSPKISTSVLQCVKRATALAARLQEKYVVTALLRTKRQQLAQAVELCQAAGRIIVPGASEQTGVACAVVRHTQVT